MITIDLFTIATDFKTINLTMHTTEVTDRIVTLEVFIGTNYLSSIAVDLTSKLLQDTNIETLVITLTDLGLDPTTILDGIFTIHVIDNATTPNDIEAAIANLYYTTLCLANMVIINSVLTTWNDINTLYLLLKSINIFLPVNKIEQALNCYERVIAMMENNPSYLVTTDLTPCTTGSGCWIINGTYVIK